MDFIRARGEEQKNIRIQQILDAAAELYEKIGYDKITFSKIGKLLNFTRINLYYYFSCKEDIFLLLLRHDIEELVKDAESTFKKPAAEIELFIDEWAALVMRHQRMLALFSIANTILLRGATDGAHAEFRAHIFSLFKKLEKSVHVALPEMDAKAVSFFVDLENSYAMALYPASIEYKKSQAIVIFTDVGFGTRNFVPQYVAYLKILLNGLLNYKGKL